MAGLRSRRSSTLRMASLSGLMERSTLRTREPPRPSHRSGHRRDHRFRGCSGPAGLAFGPGGVLYVAERDGQRVSRIDPTGAKTVVAGTGVRGESGDGGPAVAAQVDEPFDVVPAPGGELFIVESGVSGGIRHIDASGVIRTIRRR